MTVLSHSLKIILVDTGIKRGDVAQMVNKIANTVKVRGLTPTWVRTPKSSTFTVHSRVE